MQYVTVKIIISAATVLGLHIIMLFHQIFFCFKYILVQLILTEYCYYSMFLVNLIFDRTTIRTVQRFDVFLIHTHHLCMYLMCMSALFCAFCIFVHTYLIDMHDLFSLLAAPADSTEKNTKMKRRREKRKLIKRKLKSKDASDNLMSELPFCLTSPTTWKELGCVYTPNITFQFFFES